MQATPTASVARRHSGSCAAVEEAAHLRALAARGVKVRVMTNSKVQGAEGMTSGGLRAGDWRRPATRLEFPRALGDLGQLRGGLRDLYLSQAWLKRTAAVTR